MKLFILLTLSCSCVFARSVNDLMYLPDAGTWYSLTEINQDDIETNAAAGSDRAQILYQTFGYAFSKKFGMEYLIAATLAGDDTAGNDYAATLHDVEFKFKYRASEKKNEILDIKAILSPSLGDADAAAETDVTRKAGSSDASLAIEWGRKTGKHQYSLQVGVKLTSASTQEGTDTRKLAKIDQELVLNHQFSLSDKNFIRGFVGLNNVGNAENTLPAAVDYDTPSIAWGLTYGHNLSKNTLLGIGGSAQRLEVAGNAGTVITIQNIFASLLTQF